MKILDTLLGRTKPVRANLDNLFALPSASLTLQAAQDMVPTGRAGVCFKPPAGATFATTQAEIEQLLALPPDDGSTGDVAGSGAGATPPVTVSLDAPADRYGYRWILIEASAVEDLVTRAHLVHSTLEDAGWGPQLLCAVFGFAAGAAPDGTDEVTPTVRGDAPSSLYLVYLAKRGTFYPFAPLPDEQRDNELELRLRGVLGEDLPIEPDVSRWFPLWDLPVR